MCISFGLIFCTKNEILSTKAACPFSKRRRRVMKKMTRRRITALFMAVLMVVGILPLSMLTGIFSSKVAAATKTYSFDATALTTEKDKETISGKVADDYVTVFGTVQKRVKKDTLTVIATELAKSAAGGYEFTVTGTATAKIVISSTGGSNESQFTLIDAKGETVASKDGKSVISVTGTTGTEVNYELEAGTYKMVSAKEFTSRGVRVISFEIAETPKTVTKEYHFDAEQFSTKRKKLLNQIENNEISQKELVRHLRELIRQNEEINKEPMRDMVILYAQKEEYQVGEDVYQADLGPKELVEKSLLLLRGYQNGFQLFEEDIEDYIMKD